MNIAVFKATVNGIDVWRIYHNQELLATFTSESTANAFAEYLKNKENEEQS